jgi:hypothetical protein
MASVSHDVVSPWVGLGVYVAGYIVTARVVYATSRNTEDGRFNAMCAGVVWPVAGVLLVAVWLLAIPTFGVRTRGERERERGEMAARIGALEAENERLRREQERP